MVGSGTPAPDKAYIDDSSTAVDAPGGGVSPAAEVNDRMKRRQSRRSSTEDEPPVERLGCNETHHKAVLVLRQIRDHTAFTLFFILAILYSGVIVSNCCPPPVALRHDWDHSLHATLSAGWRWAI